MSACANAWHGAPIQTLGEAQTGHLGEEADAAWRAAASVAFGSRR
jgi:hypothetical protein